MHRPLLSRLARGRGGAHLDVRVPTSQKIKSVESHGANSWATIQEFQMSLKLWGRTNQNFKSKAKYFVGNWSFQKMSILILQPTEISLKCDIESMRKLAWARGCRQFPSSPGWWPGGVRVAMRFGKFEERKKERREDRKNGVVSTCLNPVCRWIRRNINVIRPLCSSASAILISHRIKNDAGLDFDASWCYKNKSRPKNINLNFCVVLQMLNAFMVTYLGFVVVLIP